MPFEKAIRQDIAGIFAQFLAANTSAGNISFKEFESFWISKDFSLIHYSCLEKERRAEFMILIYDSLFLHLASSMSAPCFCIFMYSLFLFYHTQPKALSFASIPITFLQWDLIMNSLNDFSSKNFTDPICCFDDLFKRKVFEFSLRK